MYAADSDEDEYDSDPLLSARAERDISNIEAASLALEYRKAGQSYAEIGRAMGLSTGTVSGMVRSYLRRSSRYDAAQLRQLEAERIDVLLSGIWDRAKSGSLSHIDRYIRLGQFRAQLLGLNAPAEKPDDGRGERGPTVVVISPHVNPVKTIEAPRGIGGADVVPAPDASAGGEH